MPRGGARVGAGRRPKPMTEHVLAGTYRQDRHGPRPARVLAMPPPEAAWQPTASDLTGLGSAGRELIDRLLADYDVSPVDGLQLLEAARAADVLAELRAEADSDLRQIRLWSAYYTGVLRALGMAK